MGSHLGTACLVSAGPRSIAVYPEGLSHLSVLEASGNQPGKGHHVTPSGHDSGLSSPASAGGRDIERNASEPLRTPSAADTPQ